MLLLHRKNFSFKSTCISTVFAGKQDIDPCLLDGEPLLLHDSTHRTLAERYLRSLSHSSPVICRQSAFS